MYNFQHGRFTAVDPLLASGMPGNPQTWNRYTYVLNNPLYWVDPTGLIWGKNDDGQVRWFDKKLGKGFSEFTPDAWQYEGTNGRIVQLDANSSKWNYIDPVQVVAESNPIQELAQAVTDGVTDGFTGIAKGVGNSPSVALNGVTGCIFNCGVQGAYFQGSNPFEVPLIFPYNNEREASYGSASSTGTLLGLGVAGGTIFGGSTATSVVPSAEGASATNHIYSARVLMRGAEETGPYHNFPMSFDSQIISSGTRTSTSNFVMYRQPGTINGRSGVFEIGARPSPSGRTEVIRHRFFRPSP